MKTSKKWRRLQIAALLCFGGLILLARNVNSQDRALTPRQAAIEEQRARLSSADVEDRRDAITRLAAMNHPDAARAALAGLADASAIVRATSTEAILLLPAEQSAAALIPLLKDKDEFVRREAAYALAVTRSRAAVPSLTELLTTDKKDEVRSAAAIALGEIGDSSALRALLFVFDPNAPAPAKKKKQKRENNPFVVRSAIQAIGKLKDRQAVPVLILTVRDEKADSDIRREAIVALGEIADPTATSVLEGVMTTQDPYLSTAAFEALRKIRRAKSI